MPISKKQLDRLYAISFLSPHARERWVERCWRLDFDREWEHRRELTDDEFVILRENLKKRNKSSKSWKRTRRDSKTHRYLVSPSGVVFVVSKPYLVVTVWRSKDLPIDAPVAQLEERFPPKE